MGFSPKTSIATKIVLGTVLTASLALFIGTLNIRGLQTIQGTFDKFSTQIAPGMGVLVQMRMHVFMLSIAVTNYAMDYSNTRGVNALPNIVPSEDAKIQNLTNTVHQDFNAYATNANMYFPENKQHVADIQQKLSTFDLIARNFVAVREAPVYYGDNALDLKSQLDAARGDLIVAINSAYDDQFGKFDMNQNKTISEISAFTIFVSAAASVMAAVAIIKGAWFYSGIVKPIKYLRVSANRMASGDRNASFQVSRHDEVGELSKDLEKMKDRIFQSERLKDEFLSIASHELRTPIQPILNYAQLAKKRVVPYEQAIDAILSQASRLRDLTNDILDVSKIDAGHMILAKARFDLNQLISQVVAEKSTLNANIDVQIKQKLPVQDLMIYADKSRLYQVMANLVGNALKFTKKGSVTVEAAPSPEFGKVLISVTDTGIGIPSTMQNQLFTKFASSNTATYSKTNTEAGTGLGLYICKGIIDAHEGKISGLNNPSGGATFRVELPTGLDQLEAAKISNISTA